MHVEIEPFRTTTPGPGGPRAETGCFAEGAYVEFDLPPGWITTDVGPRRTAVIPTAGPLDISLLNPKYVARRWWWPW